jgi:hypothetical protein
MSIQSLYRWGAMVIIVTGILFIASAIALIIVPGGGLANPIAPTLYYLSLILIVPSYVTLYSIQSQAAGKLGFAGFVMAVIGSIMYSGPIFVLLVGASGVPTWHELWSYSMGNVLPLGASAFLIGSILFGVATRHANVFPHNAGSLLAIGSFLWLIAFYLPIPFLLSIANLLSAAALLWMGINVYPREVPLQAQQAA